MADSRTPDGPKRVASSRRFAGLVAGPNWARSYQRQDTIPVDGTKASLRDSVRGSPFTISIVPPDLLLQAIRGEGQPSTEGIYDPRLREVFAAAEANLQATIDQVLAEGVENPFSDIRVIQAQQALAGGRANTNSAQNINIIDSSLRSTNRFSEVRKREAKFQQSNLFAVGPRREKSLQALEKFIGANGIEFKPQNVTQSAANQVAISDLDQALSVLVQLNRMTVTPPLTLLVNPETMTVSYQKKQQYQDRNRFNYIYQAWGEEQVRLNFSGKSAGFVAGSDGRVTDFGQVELGGIETRTVSGYQWASKRDSAGWQNLMNLFTLYRNNAIIYNELDRSEAHLWIGNVQISYDQVIYLGQFENFRYSLSEMKQHGAIEFSFDFTASFMFDLSQGGGQKPVAPIPSVTPSPSDPRWVQVTERPPNLSSQLTNATTETQTAEISDTATAITDLVLNGGLTPQEQLERDVRAALGPSFRF